MHDITASVRSQIMTFIQSAAQRKGISQVDQDESLIDAAIIDSMGVFRLVTFLEETFGIKISDEEISNDTFESVRTLERFVINKLSSGQSSGAVGFR